MTAARRTAILLGAALCANPAAAAPRPPARPHSSEPTPPQAVPVGTPPPNSASAPAGSASRSGFCLARLVAAGYKVEPAAQPSTDPSCHVEDPVKLAAAADPAMPGRAITFPGTPVLACAFAEVFGTFVGEVASPILAARFGGALASVETGPGFQCRPRNNQPGAKPSAHGLGLAIDVAGFTMSDGHVMAVEPAGSAPPDRVFAALRRSACGWFTTVLGPGSDAFHADHMHLDIELHGSSDRYRICQ